MPFELPPLPVTAIHPDRRAMGTAAAEKVHAEICRVVGKNGGARMVMACAPSQDDYYAALIPLVKSAPEIWRQVEIFHMDEYVGLAASAPQSFRSYLRKHFLDQVEVAAFHPIGGEQDPAEESARYEALLAAAPIDVISMGIGENGHIAFNDPPVADFDDAHLIKKVELDAICRQQQVNDGCFPMLEDVPTHALTLTLPVFARAGMLVCIVPGERKAEAVQHALSGPVGTDCPATLLRGHANSFLYLDEDSASLLNI